MCVMVLTSAVGTIATSEVPCATACETPTPMVIVGTNSVPPPMPMVPARKPAPKPPTIRITSCQLTAPAAGDSWKKHLLEPDQTEEHDHREPQPPFRNPFQKASADVRPDHAADHEEQGEPEIDLR